MLLIGSTVLFFDRDGWTRACKISSTQVVWLVHAWDILIPYTVYGFYVRGSVEDAQLKKHFGEEWQTYRCKVTYRYVPYVM